MGNARETTGYRQNIIVILSPVLILAMNYISAFFFGRMMGNWAFVPIILIEWCAFAFCIIQYGDVLSLKRWLGKSQQGVKWALLAVIVGFIPFPIFIIHKNLLTHWSIWLPWILLAIVNPWLEEFYWRGLILDNTIGWNKWVAVLFSSILFAGNHAVFGVNSVVLRGPEVVVSTLIMGIVWSFVYIKMGSLRWALISHFLVDFFSLSAPSFLDLYVSGK